MSTSYKMNGFSGFGNSPAKQKIGAGRKLGKVVGKIAKKISKSTTQDEKDAPKKKSRTLTNKMKPKGGQRLMSIRTEKNREYDEHARKTGALPDFKAIKNDSTRSAQMVKFYSNKSNVNKLNKGQTEYFKKTGGWDKKERLIK